MRKTVPYLLARVAMATIPFLTPPPPLAAQVPPLILPKASPRASVTQTVGLTAVSITYDRPGVGGRPVWGALVPFDSVWRAGANENTVIEFSSPVRLGGQPVRAGRYGLHMIPTPGPWTIILSKQANAWGSFSYDPKEDAIRLTAAPMAGEMHEQLAYTFDSVTDSSVVATLRWEKLAVPIAIQVDTKAVVVDSIREQLRGLGRFSWQTWSQAAAWSVANDTNMEEALAWADRSIRMNEAFTNIQIRATILDKRGDRAGAAAATERALAVATEAEVNLYGYGLVAQGKVDSAIAIFKKNVATYPRSWNTYDSLAEAYATKGNKKLAIEQYSKALSLTQDPTQRTRIEGVLAGLR